MKTSVKITILVVATILMIGATLPEDEKPAAVVRCFTQDEVRLLTTTNGWSQEQAEHVLELSCQYATPN